MVLGMSEYEQAFADAGFAFVHQLYELTEEQLRERINIAKPGECDFRCSVGGAKPPTSRIVIASAIACTGHRKKLLKNIAIAQEGFQA